MKKFFAIMAVATVLVACNNGGENKETTDSTTVNVDSATIVTPAPDTTVAPVDTTMHHDSTKH